MSDRPKHLSLFNNFQFFSPPFSKVPAFLNCVDIAGLVKGASEGQGLGNAFLSHISACDAIFHMCRKLNFKIYNFKARHAVRISKKISNHFTHVGTRVISICKIREWSFMQNVRCNDELNQMTRKSKGKIANCHWNCDSWVEIENWATMKQGFELFFGDRIDLFFSRNS